MASNAEAIFLDAGEAALVVEFGRTIEPDIHNRVLALDAALGKRALPGVVELVPTIRSLMIHYDPLVIERAALIDAVRGIETGAAETKPARRWTVPCCYDPQFGEDIATIAEQLGMTPGARGRAAFGRDVSGVHVRLPAGLLLSRRAAEGADGRAPRRPSARRIRRGTIMIGAGMGLITTFAMPTGWWLVGRTPERMFSLERKQTFLAAVGDEIKFEPIDLDTFHALDRRAAAGEVVATMKKLA